VPRSRIFRNATIALAVAAILIFSTRTQWMRWMGEFLVLSDSPARADVAVVLAGDYTGDRIARAAELVKAGYVPKILVSGPSSAYGVHESDLAIPFAVKHGYPREWFIPCPHLATSTYDETRAILDDLRKLHARRVLVVTSNYHTRRAGRIFRAAAPDLEIRIISAPTREFEPHSWWVTREGRKTLFFEWCKTIAYAAGI
jgi:uncharacterized SAM-binding protein YcdF (DUF218 family)